MGQTRKRNYDRYTLAYKLQAVKLANHPDVRSKDVAESLGIHPVMLYRWQMEHRRGELRENKHMKSSTPSPERRAKRADPAKEAEEKLAAAEKRIKKLERELENRNDEIDLLKKAERFFQRKK
ncbi:transposase [Alcanivorax sp.]|uniref:transposase n=1 Tax=Alcanivorax sp. TaxID=1872427 RepID=UPI00258C5708|nr:transposase [Alcanivorax sp.]